MHLTLILRALASGALVVGLLTTAPTAPEAHGASAGRDNQQRTTR